MTKKINEEKQKLVAFYRIDVGWKLIASIRYIFVSFSFRVSSCSVRSISFPPHTHTVHLFTLIYRLCACIFASESYHDFFCCSRSISSENVSRCGSFSRMCFYPSSNTQQLPYFDRMRNANRNPKISILKIQINLIDWKLTHNCSCELYRKEWRKKPVLNLYVGENSKLNVDIIEEKKRWMTQKLSLVIVMCASQYWHSHLI